MQCIGVKWSIVESGADPGKNVTGFQKGERRRREPARGVRGHAPPENFENLAL